MFFFFNCNYENEFQGVRSESLNILWYFPFEREEEGQKWNCDPKDPALTISFSVLQSLQAQYLSQRIGWFSNGYIYILNMVKYSVT